MVAESHLHQPTAPWQPTDPWLHQRIVERMPLAVMVWRAATDDPRDLRLVCISPHSRAVLGADLSPLVGRRIDEVLPAIFGRGSHRLVFAVATGREPGHNRIYRYGDERIAESWFRVNVRPLGQRCALVTCINMTEQQRAFTPPGHPASGMAVTEMSKVIGPAIENVESWLYQQIVEQMPLAVLVLWAETDDPLAMRIVYYGPHSSAVTGTDVARFVGLRFAEAFPPLQDKEIPHRFFAVATGSQPHHVEALPYPEGRSIPSNTWFQVEARPLGHRCVLVAYTNITEQQQAAASLHQREREAAALAEIGRVISASLDIQHVYAALATSVRQLIPYDRLAIATVDQQRDTITNVYSTAAPLTEWAVGKPRALRGLAIESVVRNRTPLLMQAATEAELLAKFPDAWEGLRYGMPSTIVVPLIARDEVVGLLVLRSRKVEAFTQHHLILAQQVGMQIAGAIANAWAYAALKDAEAALVRSNAELEQFAFVASHDLQEPLRVVGSYVQLLARRYAGQLDARADRYIGRSIAGVERMRTLINDLLTYSRVGTRGLELTPIRTETVVAEVLEGLAVTIRETAAEVTWDPLPVVQADAMQVGQLFQNLLGNALKYRSEQAPRVHIAVERQGQWWRFAVQDNGIGIDPAYAERIFLVFQRLHTRDEYPGTGIGLALCQKIVERHGGQLSVESQEGAGATFSFTLPAVEGDERALLPSAPVDRDAGRAAAEYVAGERLAPADRPS